MQLRRVQFEDGTRTAGIACIHDVVRLPGLGHGRLVRLHLAACRNEIADGGTHLHAGRFLHIFPLHLELVDGNLGLLGLVVYLVSREYRYGDGDAHTRRVLPPELFG